MAKCEGYTDLRKNYHAFSDELIMTPPRAEYGAVALADLAISWDQCGPIIEREWIELGAYHDQWLAVFHGEDCSIDQDGPTPLIAAMRCFVASRLGDEVDIPEELL